MTGLLALQWDFQQWGIDPGYFQYFLHRKTIKQSMLSLVMRVASSCSKFPEFILMFKSIC
jgi:hypothetical protein